MFLHKGRAALKELIIPRGRLANLAIPSLGIRFKKSSMPFMQMENISHFLRACESAPLSLPSHDRFLTVDLYENKDPAQVIQCLGAFSRVANSLSPSKFPTTIGPKKSGIVSPTRAGFGSTSGDTFPGIATSINTGNYTPALPSRNGNSPARALSPVGTGGSNSSRTHDGIPRSPPGPVSSWSKKQDEGNTAPAWNIAQYGYMGGASQGNQGIAFGGRRQITSAGPHVLGVAERERKRKEEEDAERERRRLQQEEAEQKRQIEEREAKAKRQREEEERRLEYERRKEEERRAELERKQLEEWKREDEARKLRQAERERAQEEERQWRLREIQKREEEREVEARRLEEKKEAEEKTRLESHQKKPEADPRLRGQFLSQYHEEQSSHAESSASDNQQEQLKRSTEHERLRELEQQLEEAKQREQQYLRERDALLRKEISSKPIDHNDSGPGTPVARAREQTPDESEMSWVSGDERDYLRKQWQDQQDHIPPPQIEAVSSNPHLPTRKKPVPPTSSPAPSSTRPLPDPKFRSPFHRPARPLPIPSDSGVNPPLPTRPIQEDRSREIGANSSNSDSAISTPHRATESNEISLRANHVKADPQRTSNGYNYSSQQRQQEQQQHHHDAKPKAGGWASKSLLEREMERERERQREWEEAQKRTSEARRDLKEGTRQGQSWDVNQYGWLGGDSQNKGGSGIGFGGRRQIIGPRPAP